MFLKKYFVFLFLLDKETMVRPVLLEAAEDIKKKLPVDPSLPKKDLC